MAKNIKILQLQVLFSDASLVNSVLIKSDLKFERLIIDTKEKLYAAIDVFNPDIILTDEVITFETGPGIPFIIFADYVSPEFEANAFLRGAADYIYKDRPYRLVKAIQTIIENVTEKKQISQAFGFEKRRINELFLQATTSMGILMGPDHVYAMANPLYLKLIGKKDIIGKSLREVLPGVRCQGYHELLDEVYQTGNTISANEMLATVFDEDSGEQKNIFINLSYQAYRNPAGKVIGIFFFIVEVTNEIEARKKIQESETRYRQIVETSQEGVLLMDNFNDITFVNKRICDILDYTAQELLGMSIYSFMDQEQPIVQGQQAVNFVSKSGKSILANVSANPIYDDKGVLKGSLAMVSDVTEKKNLEDLLNRANSMARIGGFEFNLLTGKLYWSAITREIHEVDPDFSPTYQSILTFYKPGVPKELLEQTFNDAFLYGTPVDCEFEIVTAKGNERWIRVIGEAEVVNGQVTKVYGSLQDVTDRKLASIRALQLNEDLKKYTRELVISNKELEQFSYIISHNLRSPVANIIGLVEELKDDAHLPEVKQMLRDSLSVSVNVLDNTIIDLNTILKVKNEINENRERVYFLELISNIQLSLKKLFHNAHVTIHTDFDEVNEMFTLKSYMQSIFFNLITNSVKYRKPDVSPLIVIRSERADNKLILTFKDNGLGMDLKNKGDELFGLYKRFHDHVEGKGMGLFMVKTQVETLGGKITVDSEVNKGTAFKLVFPLN
jgi:PAS domain S-box-containing protein